MPQQIPGQRPEAPGGDLPPEEVARQLERLEHRIENQTRKRLQLQQELQMLEQRGQLQPRSPRLRHDLERLEAAIAEVDQKIQDFRNRARKLRGEPIEEAEEAESGDLQGEPPEEES